MKPIIAALFALAVSASPALAEPVHVGKLMIDGAWTRATPPKAPVAGGFMVISNMGDEPDRLVGGAAPFAKRVEVHEMKIEDEIMKMREIEGGLEIPPGGSVELKPGGYHIMFMGLQQQLMEGEAHTVTLTFEKAGEVELQMPVENMNKGRMHRMKGSGHGAGHGMQHGKTN